MAWLWRGDGVGLLVMHMVLWRCCGDGVAMQWYSVLEYGDAMV